MKIVFFAEENLFMKVILAIFREILYPNKTANFCGITSKFSLSPNAHQLPKVHRNTPGGGGGDSAPPYRGIGLM